MREIQASQGRAVIRTDPEGILAGEFLDVSINFLSYPQHSLKEVGPYFMTFELALHPANPNHTLRTRTRSR